MGKKKKEKNSKQGSFWVVLSILILVANYLTKVDLSMHYIGALIISQIYMSKM